MSGHIGPAQRPDDMSRDGWIRVIIEEDGDAILTVHDGQNQQRGAAQLCSSGGRSQASRLALHLLYLAMLRDQRIMPLATRYPVDEYSLKLLQNADALRARVIELIQGLVELFSPDIRRSNRGGDDFGAPRLDNLHGDEGYYLVDPQSPTLDVLATVQRHAGEEADALENAERLQVSWNLLRSLPLPALKTIEARFPTDGPAMLRYLAAELNAL